MASRILQHAAKALAAGGAGLGAAAAYRYREVQQAQAALPKQQLFAFKDDQSPSGKKKVVVIGGGVVGVTAAYKLALKGHQVVLLEPRSAPGKECSACAAGGMQRSNPVVDRGTWVAVTKSCLPFTRYFFGGSNEPYQFFNIEWFPALTDALFLRWSATFTKTSLFPGADQ